MMTPQNETPRGQVDHCPGRCERIASSKVEQVELEPVRLCNPDLSVTKSSIHVLWKWISNSAYNTIKYRDSKGTLTWNIGRQTPVAARADLSDSSSSSSASPPAPHSRRICQVRVCREVSDRALSQSHSSPLNNSSIRVRWWWHTGSSYNWIYIL